MSDILEVTEAWDAGNEENRPVKCERMDAYDDLDAETTILKEPNTVNGTENFLKSLPLGESCERLTQPLTSSELPCSETRISNDTGLMGSITPTADVVIKDEPKESETSEIIENHEPVRHCPLNTENTEANLLSDPLIATDSDPTRSAITPNPPQIQVIPVHRLSVKQEFRDLSATDNDVNSCGTLIYDSATQPNIVYDEMPENFFDDFVLSPDGGPAEEGELEEEKYSDRLKEQLNDKHPHKEKTKHKTSKNKSRKRSCSRSENRSRDREAHSPPRKHMKKKNKEEDESPLSANISKRNNDSATQPNIVYDEMPENFFDDFVLSPDGGPAEEGELEEEKYSARLKEQLNDKHPHKEKTKHKTSKNKSRKRSCSRSENRSRDREAHSPPRKHMKMKNKEEDESPLSANISKRNNDSATQPNIVYDEMPENFFDDFVLSPDGGPAEEGELEEEKYSARLKEQLNDKHPHKEKKKHKTSKNKSRKRSCSRSENRSRDREAHSPPRKHMKKKKRKNKEEDELPLSANISKRNKGNHHNNDSNLSNNSIEQSDSPHFMTTTPPKDEDTTEKIDTSPPHLAEIYPHFTTKQKMERSSINTKILLTYLKSIGNDEELPFTTFLHTSTVRVLPPSNSYLNQHIYENRSPLNNVHNVKFRFSSQMHDINFEEWGLASLPPTSAKLAKLLGFDAAAVHKILKEINIPSNLKNESEAEDGGDLYISTHKNASTQTDELVELKSPKGQNCDYGVQVKPKSFEVECQTLETESPCIKQFDNETEFTLITKTRHFNENELMALVDFADIIREPARNAMDMYNIRQRLLNIYKSSQIPSTLGPSDLIAGNSYRSNEFSSNPRQQHNNDIALRIETVSSGDGRKYLVNTPRECYNSTQPSLQQNSSSGPSYESNHRNQIMPEHKGIPPSMGKKYYGRGGFRH